MVTVFLIFIWVWWPFLSYLPEFGDRFSPLYLSLVTVSLLLTWVWWPFLFSLPEFGDRFSPLCDQSWPVFDLYMLEGRQPVIFQKKYQMLKSIYWICEWIRLCMLLVSTSIEQIFHLKLSCSNPYIFANWYSRPWVLLDYHSQNLKY